MPSGEQLVVQLDGTKGTRKNAMKNPKNIWKICATCKNSSMVQAYYLDVPVSPRFGFCMAGHIVGDGSYLIPGNHRCDSWAPQKDKATIRSAKNDIKNFCCYFIEHLLPKIFD